MSEESVNSHNRSVEIISLVATILLIILISVNAIRSMNEDTCGTQEVTVNNFNNIVEGQTLTTKNSYLLTPFNKGPKKNPEYKFCFWINVSGKSQAITIINEQQKTLWTGAVDNQTNNYCADLNSNSFEYLGIKCSSCNTTNNITIGEIVGSQTTKNWADTGTINDRFPSYNLYGLKSCWEQNKFFIKLWAWLLFGLWLTIGILRGYDWLEKTFFGGME